MCLSTFASWRLITKILLFVQSRVFALVGVAKAQGTMIFGKQLGDFPKCIINSPTVITSWQILDPSKEPLEIDPVKIDWSKKPDNTDIDAI